MEGVEPGNLGAGERTRIKQSSVGWLFSNRMLALRDCAWVAGGVGLLLAWMATFAYVRPAREAFVNGREGRALG